MAKALALLSGGLDSTLAVRALIEQNVEVEAIHFTHVFLGTDWKEATLARRAAGQLGVSLRVEDVSEKMIDMVKSPTHGYGSNMNPCIDCRICALKRAAEVMGETGADFLITGEVVGERPMSQRRDAMRMIEKKAGVAGLVLRPLSARLLPPTLPAEKGWVNADRLFAISGRSRKPQFELAAIFGIEEFPSPAGGCLLTDPGFAARMSELLAHAPECDLNDVDLLRFGRHFRLAPGVKAVVGRNESENGAIEGLARDGDMLMAVEDWPGPTTLVRGPASEEHLASASAITARYARAAPQPGAKVKGWHPNAPGRDDRCVEATPASADMLSGLRIATRHSDGGGGSE